MAMNSSTPTDPRRIWTQIAITGRQVMSSTVLHITHYIVLHFKMLLYLLLLWVVTEFAYFMLILDIVKYYKGNKNNFK